MMGVWIVYEVSSEYCGVCDNASWKERTVRAVCLTAEEAEGVASGMCYRKMEPEIEQMETGVDAFEERYQAGQDARLRQHHEFMAMMRENRAERTGSKS